MVATENNSRIIVEILLRHSGYNTEYFNSISIYFFKFNYLFAYLNIISKKKVFYNALSTLGKTILSILNRLNESYNKFKSFCNF